jgi:hypothetical protein
MGIIIHVYRAPDGDFTNGGISGRVKTLTVVNVEGPFEPTPDRPAVILTTGPLGHPIIVPVREPVETPDIELIGPMFGGNLADTSDSRWGRAVRNIAGRYSSTAVPIHDRFETHSLHEALTRD